MSEKTNVNENDHILWNPDKNYLGSWDVPGEGDLILTIKSVEWEEVKNPQTGASSSERVIRFKEDVKPMICNETNARSINLSTGKDFRSEMGGEKISIYAELGTWFGKECKALRIRENKVKNKEVLCKSHPKWEMAKDNVKNGSIDLDGLRKHWEVSDESFKKLQS